MAYHMYFYISIIFCILYCIHCIRYYCILYLCSILPYFVLLLDITVFGIAVFCIVFDITVFSSTVYHVTVFVFICISYNYSRLHCITLIPINVHYTASMILFVLLYLPLISWLLRVASYAYRYLIPRSNTMFVFNTLMYSMSSQCILTTLIEVQTGNSFIEVLAVDNISNILVMSSCMFSRCRSKTFKKSPIYTTH